MIKIPDMKSKYIPVGNLYPKEQDVIWWEPESDFYYPYVLLNLDTVERSDLDKYNIKDNVFLLTDSGGFQALRGTCNFNWETSLLQQIKLKASKIFSFDIPPVKRTSEEQNTWIALTQQETKKIIEENIDVAIKQSRYLKEKHPEELKKFCIIIQAPSKDMMDYNLSYLKSKIGDNFKEYFPGGVVYSVKSQDILLYAICSKHAQINFINKGIYVHFLGMGSFNKMLVLIRNEISTFDSSNALRGAISWSVNNPIMCEETFISSKDDFAFAKNFCFCPTCRKKDYIKMLDESPELVGRNFVKHNLWHILKMNIFLDSIKKNKYTSTVKEMFKPSKNVLMALEFCDEADKRGYDEAYNKYKPYLKKDNTKQHALF